jgi:hypothetical protein
VVASLLAKAVCQLAFMLLTLCHREQARSHKDSRVAGMGSRFKCFGAVLSSQPAGFQGAAHSSGVLVSEKRKYE